MGKKIIWSPTSLGQLEEIHENILDISRSLDTADRVVNDILGSVDVLRSQSDIYSIDEYKYNNDGSYRSYEIRSYNIAYRVLKSEVRIIRVRYSGKEPRSY